MANEETSAFKHLLSGSLMHRTLIRRFDIEFPTFQRVVQKISFPTVITLFEMLKKKVSDPYQFDLEL